MSKTGNIIRGAGGYLKRNTDLGVGIGHPHGGDEGDIRVQMVDSSPHLYARAGGQWYGINLSTITDDTMRLGDSRDYLSINPDVGLELYNKNVKVATFGETTTVKDINLTGVIEITSTGGQNVMMGRWAAASPDVSGVENNVVLGTEAGQSMESGAEDNVIIGTTAGDAITTGKRNVAIGNNALSEADSTHNCVAVGGGALRDTTGYNNIGIGQAAGAEIITGTNNIAIGGSTLQDNEDVIGAIAIGKDAGGNHATAGFMGNYSICIGQRADVGTDDDTNSIVIGRHVVGKGSNTVVIGNDDVTDFYAAADSGATVHCTSLTLKETTTPTPVADNGKLYTKNDNKLYFQDGAGTEHEVSFV